MQIKDHRSRGPRHAGGDRTYSKPFFIVYGGWGGAATKLKVEVHGTTNGHIENNHSCAYF